VGELKFDRINHMYSLRGRRLESVTEVLERAGICDYTSTGLSRGEALWRGSTVHEAIALDLEGDLDDRSVPEICAGYVEASRRFRRERHFECELHEYYRHHKDYMYAGTLDAKGWADLGEGKRRYLLDWKTGRAQSWVRYQLAAYAGFFESPGAELRLCVELHSDGSYTLFEFSPADFRSDYDIFLSALAVVRVREKEKKLWPRS